MEKQIEEKRKYTSEGCELFQNGKSIQVFESEKAAKSIANTLERRYKRLEYLNNLQDNENSEEALSKAEDKGELNNCDGCRAGMPLVGIYHKNEQGKTHMICSKGRYATQPMNSLDELERWVNEQEKNQRHFTVIRTDDLLSKIQELKTITT